MTELDCHANEDYIKYFSQAFHTRFLPIICTGKWGGGGEGDMSGMRLRERERERERETDTLREGGLNLLKDWTVLHEQKGLFYMSNQI